MAKTNGQRIALVTGANKGIGFEIARQLGQLGIHVLLASRDPSNGETASQQLKAEHLDVQPVTIDVTDPASIAAAAQWVDETYGRLDILVNNAGISREYPRTAPSEFSLSRLQETYATNVFAVVAVTNAFLPLLRRSTSARIVNQSSAMGSLTLAADPASPYAALILLAYNSSKAALNSITLEYAKELRNSAIKVNAADPGYCATDLNGHQGYRTPAQGAAASVTLATLPDDGPSGTFTGDNGPVPW
jgi:NAD(P)-dependent dehydrogenase (short-subunit alcohol dehydrogenase family)